MELTETLNAMLRKKSSAEWLEQLEAAGVPAGPVLDILQMHADPQTIARQMVAETDHPVAGRVKTIGLPVKFSGTPGAVTRPAPLLGEHTREVLAEAGLDGSKIEELIKSGAAISAK